MTVKAVSLFHCPFHPSLGLSDKKPSTSKNKQPKQQSVPQDVEPKQPFSERNKQSVKVMVSAIFTWKESANLFSLVEAKSEHGIIPKAFK